MLALLLTLPLGCMHASTRSASDDVGGSTGAVADRREKLASLLERRWIRR